MALAGSPQYLRARPSETTATGTLPETSCRVKTRPATSGVPTASKYSGETITKRVIGGISPGA